jgi:uncharacterized protein YcbK (DUF882 family)
MADDIDIADPEAPLHRRALFRLGLGMGVGAAVAMALGAPERALAAPPSSGALLGSAVRKVTLRNINTGEQTRLDYWVQGRYDTDALREANHLLRDHHDGSTHRIDPRLLDLMCAIQRVTASTAPIHVICGYRSPRTNARMRWSRRGVSGHSLHMLGKAVDIRIPGVDLSRVHHAALMLHGGGVGFYPRSDFVHIDVGAFRTWGAHGHGGSQGEEWQDETVVAEAQTMIASSEAEPLDAGAEPVQAQVPRSRVRQVAHHSHHANSHRRNPVMVARNSAGHETVRHKPGSPR